MSEANSGARWKLTVWFDSSEDKTTFEFATKPNVRTRANVMAYDGEREDLPIEAYVSMDRVSAWSLEEIRQ